MPDTHSSPDRPAPPDDFDARWERAVGARSRPSRRRPLALILGLLIGLAVIVGIVRYLDRAPDWTVATFTAVEGVAERTSWGQTTEARPGETLRAGDRLTVLPGSRVTLRDASGTEWTVAGGTTIRLTDAPPVREGTIVLETGWLSAARPPEPSSSQASASGASEPRSGPTGANEAPVPRAEPLPVQTAVATIDVRPGEVTIDHREGLTRIVVTAGEAIVTDRVGWATAALPPTATDLPAERASVERVRPVPITLAARSVLAADTWGMIVRRDLTAETPLRWAEVDWSALVADSDGWTDTPPVTVTVRFRERSRLRPMPSSPDDAKRPSAESTHPAPEAADVSPTAVAWLPAEIVSIETPSRGPGGGPRPTNSRIEIGFPLPPSPTTESGPDANASISERLDEAALPQAGSTATLSVRPLSRFVPAMHGPFWAPDGPSYPRWLVQSAD